MKFLCLHGSFGSAKNFQVQLAPFVKETTSKCNAEYRFISGRHPATPPPGYEDYFGEGPLFRYIPFDGINAHNDTISKLSEFPTTGSPEENLRQLIESSYGSNFTKQGVKEAIVGILDVINEDPEIEGILGYSEGATTAASLIAEERRRWEEEGIPRRIKCAVFFAGWPPLSIKGEEVSVNLPDEQQDDIIDVPTCHIIGCNDPYLDGAMALFSMCDEDTAELFDHGKGHTLPRDSTTLNELVDVVNRLVERAEIRCRESGFGSNDEDDSSSNISSESPGFATEHRSSAATSVESFFAKEGC